MGDERMRTAFALAADEYERGRPGYPVAAIDLLAEELELGTDVVILDLAAGTGKLTRDLVGRFGRVIAVEPLDEIGPSWKGRDQAKRRWMAGRRRFRSPIIAPTRSSQPRLSTGSTAGRR